MSDAIMTALIMAAGSIIVQLLINRSDRKKRESDAKSKESARKVEDAQKAERLNARLETIERTLEENNRKLDVHNGYADKLGTIQQDIAYIKGKLEGVGA